MGFKSKHVHFNPECGEAVSHVEGMLEQTLVSSLPNIPRHYDDDFHGK